MPTPCIRCQHPLNTPGVCSNCDTNQHQAETSLKLGETDGTGSASTTCVRVTSVEVLSPHARSSATQQQQPLRINDHQGQITQQLQARSKLTPLQPKPIRLALPRVLDRNLSRPRINQRPGNINSSASQVSQQVQHQIRNRCRLQVPRQNIITPRPHCTTKYQIIPKNECQGVRGVNSAQPAERISGGSASIRCPIRFISSTSSAHNSSPVAPSIGKSRVTHLVRAVTPVEEHSVAPSQQLVRIIEPTDSAVVTPTTPSAPLQFKVAVSNGHTPPLYKVLYSVPSRPAIAGFSSSQSTPLTVCNSRVVSKVLVTPSGALQVVRHATNPSAQSQQSSSYFKQITHQSSSVMGPTRARLLRSKALPSVASRLAIEPPPVVTIDDEEVGSSNPIEDEGTNGREMVEFDYYKLSVLKQPDDIDKGEFRLRAHQVRIGSFVLSNRLVTFSRSKLRILARPVDSLTEEVELCFTYKDIVKVVWATNSETPAFIFNMTPGCGERIREALHMQYHDAVKDYRCNDAKHPYFEPKSEFGRQKQVVIILGEPLSEAEYSLIEDCYISPKGPPKKEHGEGLLESTEPNTQTSETPLLSPSDASVPSRIDGNSPGASILLTPTGRKRTAGHSFSKKFVTSNGIVTVTSPPPARSMQSSTELPTDVTFTNDSPICRYPPSGKGGIVIRAPDLLTLSPDSSVNDAVIDFYLSYIIGELLPKDRAEKIFAFNTFFYSSLVKAPQRPENTGIPKARRQHANVKRWTKGVDLFTKDFILIPVCEHSHWFLIIVCYPWLVAKKHGIDLDSLNAEPGGRALTQAPTEDSLDSSKDDPAAVSKTQKAPPSDPPSPMQRRSDLRAALFVFDSLRGNVASADIFPLIRDYLAEEFLAKKGVQCTFDWFSMRGYYPNSPQQTNYHDCGIFLLENARKFLLNPPEPQALGASHMFENMFDPELVMQKGRWEVAEVMFQLSEKQFPELKGVPRMKYEHRIKVEGGGLRDESRTPQLKRLRAANKPPK